MFSDIVFLKGVFVCPLGMLMLHKWLFCKCLREMPVLKGLRVLPFGSGDFLVGVSVFLADRWWGFVWLVREKVSFADRWLGSVWLVRKKVSFADRSWIQGVLSMFWAVFVDGSWDLSVPSMFLGVVCCSVLKGSFCLTFRDVDVV